VDAAFVTAPAPSDVAVAAESETVLAVMLSFRRKPWTNFSIDVVLVAAVLKAIPLLPAASAVVVVAADFASEKQETSIW